MYLILAIDNTGGISRSIDWISPSAGNFVGFSYIDPALGTSKIPWDYPYDLRHFQGITSTAPSGKKNVLIMGANTWNSTRHFPDRISIVVTSGKTPLVSKPDPVITASSLSEAEKIAKSFPEVFRIFVIGGSNLFNEAYPQCEGVFLTKINHDYHCDNRINFFQYSQYTDLEINFDYIGVRPDRDEYEYLNLIKRVYLEGEKRQTRNGPTRSIFSAELSFSLNRFPLLTTKKMFLKGIVEELLFFLRGETNTKSLSEKGVKIWEPNTSSEFLASLGLSYQPGDMGPMYGFQWRHYGGSYRSSEDFEPGIDTFEDLLNEICRDPNSRRLIISSLNMSQVKQGVLWPCHGLVIQFYVSRGELSCKMYQRSADIFLGMPFNIASYAILVYIICNLVTNRGHPLRPGRLHLSFGDVHLYEEHCLAANSQMARIPFEFPILTLDNSSSQVEDIRFENFSLSEYTFYPTIPARMIA